MIMRSKSKLILVLFVATASCATSVRYTPAAHTSRATASGGVVVGSVDTQPDSIYVDSRLTPELVAEMNRVAENAGCDELVMDGSTPAPQARYGGHAFTTVSYHASCVVHREVHTR
jgi:hypothetical protein